jgi:hypothetical protein
MAAQWNLPPRGSSAPGQTAFVVAPCDKIKIECVTEALDGPSVLLWREQGKIRH